LERDLERDAAMEQALLWAAFLILLMVVGIWAVK